MPLWPVLVACALVIGFAWGSIAPESWNLAPADGILLGSALYMAAWKRFVERRETAWTERGESGWAWRGLVAGLALRAALFVALVSLQATLCFEVVPNADVRRGFIVLSAWIVMLALIDAGQPAVAPVTAASRPPSR